MLKAGSVLLSIWGGINFLLAALILIAVILLDGDSPLLVMVFEPSEIASLDSRVIAALNTLTILYNSCAVALSIFALFIIWSNLIRGQKWAFWVLLTAIGLVELLANIASAEVGNARWQVNVVLSVLYVLGIGISGYGIFRRPSSNLMTTQSGLS